MSSVQNFVWSGRFKHGDMEDWVYTLHRFRETDGKQMGARFGDDFKRTGVFVREFFGWLGGAEEFGFNEDLLSDGKRR